MSLVFYRDTGRWSYAPLLDGLRAQGIDFVKVFTGGDPAHLPARRAYEKAGFDIALPTVDYFQRL